jgi:hypothetical protein
VNDRAGNDGNMVQRVGDEPAKIVLTDDHSVVRNGLRMVLDAEPDLEVVAEAGDLDVVLTMQNDPASRVRRCGRARSAMC